MSLYMMSNKMLSQRAGIAFAVLGISLLIGGCSGGGSDTATSDAEINTATSDAEINGVVATGLAAANVPYKCTDDNVQTLGEGFTGVDGSYQVILTAAEITTFSLNNAVKCTATLSSGENIATFVTEKPTLGNKVIGNINLITNLVATELAATGQTVTAAQVTAIGKEVVSAVIGKNAASGDPMISYETFATQSFIARSATTEASAATQATVSAADIVLDTIVENLKANGATSSSGSVTDALVTKYWSDSGKAAIIAGTAKAALNDPDVQIELAANATNQGVSTSAVTAIINDTDVKSTVQAVKDAFDAVRAEAKSSTDSNVSSNATVVVEALAKAAKVAVVAQTVAATSAGSPITAAQIKNVATNTTALVKADVITTTGSAAASIAAKGFSSTEATKTLQAVVETAAKQGGAIVGQVDVVRSNANVAADTTVATAITTNAATAISGTKAVLITAVESVNSGSADVLGAAITNTVVQDVATKTREAMDAVVVASQTGGALANAVVQTSATMETAVKGKALVGTGLSTTDFQQPVVEVVIEQPFTTTVTVTLGANCAKAEVVQQNADKPQVVMMGGKESKSSSGAVGPFYAMNSQVKAIRIDALGFNVNNVFFTAGTVSSSLITTSAGGTKTVDLSVSCPAVSTTGGTGGT